MTIEKRCRACGRTFTLTVRDEDWQRLSSGQCHVQEAFPYLTPDERELFLSGLCGKCFDDLLCR